MASNGSNNSKIQNNVFSKLRVIPFPSKSKRNTVDANGHQIISNKTVIQNVVSLKIDNNNRNSKSINSQSPSRPDQNQSQNGLPRSPRSRQLNYSPTHSSSPSNHNQLNTNQQAQRISKSPNNPIKDTSLTPRKTNNPKAIIDNSIIIEKSPSKDNNFENVAKQAIETNKSNINQQIVSSVQRIDFLTSAFRKLFSQPQLSPSNPSQQIQKHQYISKNLNPSRQHINEGTSIHYNRTNQKSKPTKPTACKHQQIICYHFSELPISENKNTSDKPVSPASGSNNNQQDHFVQTTSTKTNGSFNGDKNNISKITRSLERLATARAAFYQVPYEAKPRIHNNVSMNNNSSISCSPFSNSILRNKISSNNNRIDLKQQQYEKQYLEGSNTILSRKQSQNLLPTTSQVSVRTLQLLNQSLSSIKTAYSNGLSDGINPSIGIQRINVHKNREQKQITTDCDNTNAMTTDIVNTNNQIDYQQPKTKESKPTENSIQISKQNEEIVNNSKLKGLSKELGESTNQAIISYFIGTQSSSPFRNVSEKVKNNHKSNYCSFNKDHHQIYTGSSNSLGQISSQDLSQFQEEAEENEEEEYQSTPISPRHIASYFPQQDHRQDSSKRIQVFFPSSNQLDDLNKKNIIKQSKRNSFKSRSKSKRKLPSQTSKMNNTHIINQVEVNQQVLAEKVDKNENGNQIQEQNLNINLAENANISKSKIIQKSNTPRASSSKQISSKKRFSIPKMKLQQQNFQENEQKEMILKEPLIINTTEGNNNIKEEVQNTQNKVLQKSLSQINHSVQVISSKFKRTYKSHSPKGRPATAMVASSKAK